MILTKNIKEYCQEKKAEIKKRIVALGQAPKLAVVQIGNNEASNRYIRNKRKDCEEVGINFEWYYFDEGIAENDLLFELEEIQKFADGVIVQMPLPKHIDAKRVKMAIEPERDVDGFHPMSLFKPCTPLGIVGYMIDGCGYSFEGKNVVIFGRSDIVGKPLAAMLTDLDATVTLCHSKSKGINKYIDNANLIVSAVGKNRFLNCFSIYKPVIDVGINFDENGKIVGDCFNTEDRDVTPVPGGVGLLTRVALLENAVLALEMQKGKN